ncbi:hypothetical protein KO561_05870 [Radiobacillus kanasensis]|uniref:hypothetical protein n=1 Tax=Radiobacillus kanasensis TaxID=2844358 RepID=UPI001E59C51D|nr:hypothetical protein [Radiobacillus kanasensis]UFU00467.1 hypothetical protein KO561_05870 [Radiobacillus kanasensis]
MAKKDKKVQDAPNSREKYELDVDRMISEGIAGGTTESNHGRMQIEEARELPKEHEPFPEAIERD